MNLNLSKALFALIIMTNLSTYAQNLNKAKLLGSSVSRGGVATGGGDLCEDRIQEVRNDIKAWIVAGGSNSLNLENGISSSDYYNKMLAKITSAKIRCVSNGDAGYPVAVEGTPKVCRFDRSLSLDLITCDSAKFQALSETQQYVLVHHEYAGLADIERPNGADSDYRVSNQISSNLADTVVKKLVVKAVSFVAIPEARLAYYKEILKATIVTTQSSSYCTYNEYSGDYLLEILKTVFKGKMKTDGPITTFVLTAERGKYKNIIKIELKDQEILSASGTQYVWSRENDGKIEDPKLVWRYLFQNEIRCGEQK